MTAIQPDRNAPQRRIIDGGIGLGRVGLIGGATDVLCDGCHQHVREAVGLVRDWQPTLWFCSRCVSERLDP